MARKNEYGKYIISAGEVGSYIVCPEAWHLDKISNVRPIHSESVEKGNALHKEWSENLDEAMYFTRSTKFIILLMLLSLLFFIIRFQS